MDANVLFAGAAHVTPAPKCAIFPLGSLLRSELNEGYWAIAVMATSCLVLCKLVKVSPQAVP